MGIGIERVMPLIRPPLAGKGVAYHGYGPLWCRHQRVVTYAARIAVTSTALRLCLNKFQVTSVYP